MNHRIVIIGGGFAGLSAANELGRQRLPVTVVDRMNHHLFQPLLYQVATGFLAPGDIASPIRSALAKYQNVSVKMDHIESIDSKRRIVIGKHGEIPYDTLIIATGVTHSYFGHSDWAPYAPGLKTIEDATIIRAKLIDALEKAECAEDANQRRALLTFAVIGGGPTGVELAGALAELVRATSAGEYRNFGAKDIQIILIEGADRILPSFKPASSQYASQSLARLGVSVMIKTFVTQVGENFIEYKQADKTQRLNLRTVLWAAGVQGSPIGAILEQQFGASLDKVGRVIVDDQLAIPGTSNVFVIGDLAHYTDDNGMQLPGVAPVAIQQGRFVAKVIKQRLAGAADPLATGPLKFRYIDRGSMAVIGRGRAVAESGKLRFVGFPAWAVWGIVHIYFLIEFENKIVVFFRWLWNYLTNQRGSRLIVKYDSSNNA